MRRLQYKPVHLMVHPDFFNQIERERKKAGNYGLNFSQVELTKRLLIRNIRLPNLKGAKNVKQKRRSY